jgi:hypothetical protein
MVLLTGLLTDDIGVDSAYLCFISAFSSSRTALTLSNLLTRQIYMQCVQKPSKARVRYQYNWLRALVLQTVEAGAMVTLKLPMNAMVAAGNLSVKLG